MKRLFLTLAVLSLITFLNISTKAQGILKDTSIVFLGTNRNISIYTPSDYSPSIPVNLLIGLHGMGDNCKNYINSMMNLFPESAMPNTIIICPDGGNDSNRDFYTPVGDETIIQTAIDIATSIYNVDTSQITLQGFSFGGRSALRYGLSYPEKFKALLLNTPAVQGVKEAVTLYSEGGIFQYSNASKIPIYITNGNKDVSYLAPIDSLTVQLVRHDAKVIHYLFDMGHNIPPLVNMLNYFQLTDSLYLSNYDIDIIQVNIPQRTCETSVPFSVLVQNKGSKILTNIKFSYNIGGTSYHYLWTGELMPFQHLDIEFPNIDVSSGAYTLTVNVDSLNISFRDNINYNYNNSANASFSIAMQSKTLPYVESFSNADFQNDWIMIPSGDYYTTLRCHSTGKFLYAFNTIRLVETMGRKEEIMSPLLDLSSISTPSIAFDVAYAYTLYTANVTGSTELIFADTLEVLISTDCGKTYESLYKKGGKDLLTFKNPLTNVADPNVFLNTFPSSTDWRRDWIDLSPYAENTSAIIKFSYISAQGGLIFLDNISFSNETNIKDMAIEEIVIFPNPVHDILIIHSGNYPLKSVNLYDISGKKVKSYTANDESSIEIHIDGVSNGLYLVELTTSCGKRIIKKISIKN